MRLPLCLLLFAIMTTTLSAQERTTPPYGAELLLDLNGHWVGENVTPFGYFHWFTFDFRPISPSHLHCISEGGTNQSIINSFFIADFEGKQQLMARNGGWLFEQYRATYFVLDKMEKTDDHRYYRLVDAVGGAKRAYMEFKFVQDSLYFDAYKDDAGSADEPRHHMGFAGERVAPDYRLPKPTAFRYPQFISAVNFDGKFNNLVDPDSALFLEEANDPFPKTAHPNVSDLTINIKKPATETEVYTMIYLTTVPLVDEYGIIQHNDLNNGVSRAIVLQGDETSFTCTYVPAGRYYLTVFTDLDDNQYPSAHDPTNGTLEVVVTPETPLTVEVELNKRIKWVR